MSNRRCAAKTCFNLQGCRPNLKFFTFPKDEAACRQWVTNCGRIDLLDKPIEQLSQPIPTIFHNNLADFIPKSLRKQYEQKYARKPELGEISVVDTETAHEELAPESETSILLPRHGCHKMCRLCACLVYEDKLVSIFCKESEDQNILVKINRLLPEKVEVDDGLPHHICRSCLSKLNDCSLTVDAFIAADKKLRDLFQGPATASPSLTYIKLKEEKAEKSNVSVSSFKLETDSSIVQKSVPASQEPERFEETSIETTTYAVTSSDSLNIIKDESNEQGAEELYETLEQYSSNLFQTEPENWSECNPATESKEVITSDVSEIEKVYICLVCRKVFQEKHKLLIHEITQHAGETKKSDGLNSSKKYKRRETHKCVECGNCFQGLKPLKRHIREEHIPAENICEFCGAHYKIKSQLDVHRRLHTDEKPFSCNVCNESFHFKKALKRHKRNHVEPKSLTCTICNKTFANRSAMWRHEQIHSTNRSVLCYLCGKVLSNSQSLRVHMRTHSTDRPCSCPTCGKTFRDNISVNKHMIMHSAVKNFKCDICGRAFYSKGLVKQHKLSHSGVKPHKCEVCGAAFNRLGNLNQHKKKHVQDGTLDQVRSNLTHMCVVCGKMLKSELTLKYHLAKHTGEKKPFDCEVCGKRFVAVDPYRVHMRIHTGERPYECSMCEKKFRSAFTLKQHSALHKDEFPYPCTFCDRRFKRLQSLIVHKRTHTGEKPHLCPICGRGFAQKGDMLKHTKTHNRDRKPMAMELEHITELVLSDTEITSEFLIDMPIVEVETEMNSDMQSQLHSSIDSRIKSEIDSAMQPVIHSQIQRSMHAQIEPCIHMEIQPDIHPDMSSDINTDIGSDIPSELQQNIGSDIHSEIHTVIEAEIYSGEMQS